MANPQKRTGLDKETEGRPRTGLDKELEERQRSKKQQQGNTLLLSRRQLEREASGRSRLPVRSRL